MLDELKEALADPAYRAYHQHGCRTPECKAANARYHKAYRKTVVGKRVVRNMNLKQYGINVDDYERMLAEQGGVCAACGQKETAYNQHGPHDLAVDHDHETGVVRGLLCMRCNRALGLLGDNADRVQALAEYRRKVGDANV